MFASTPKAKCGIGNRIVGALTGIGKGELPRKRFEHVGLRLTPAACHAAVVEVKSLPFSIRLSV